MRYTSRLVGLVLGVVADAVLGDPVRLHPVAGFGATVSLLESRMYSDRRGAGAWFAAGIVLSTAAVGAAVQSAARGPVGRSVVVAAATWTVLGGTTLRREGIALAAEVERGDVTAARERLPSLCGRDPAQLELAAITRAGLESVAENTSDAMVAPLMWGAVAGVPGLLAYRAVNTLDAMVGHRSQRYRRFGWAAARLDDAANLVPARITAVLVVLLAPLVGGRPDSALRHWWTDGRRHPSPNAGPVEAAFAGALGVTLGGPTPYAHGAELRPRLGAGPPPTAADLRRAARLSGLVGAAAAVLVAGVRG